MPSSRLRSKYGEALPEFLSQNQAMVEDTQRQVDSVEQQVLIAQEKESVFSVQLNQMSPNLITQSGDLTDMATVRAKLTEAQQRYTPDHPEVKRLHRALETLWMSPRSRQRPPAVLPWRRTTLSTRLRRRS